MTTRKHTMTKLLTTQEDCTMKRFALLAAVLLLAATAAKADLLDPADIHLFNSVPPTTASSGGVDWVTFTGFNHTFDVEDVSHKTVNIDWHLVIALPGAVGSTTDEVTQIGSTVLKSPVLPGAGIALGATGSAYDVLNPPTGVKGDGSISLTNFNLVQAVLGLPQQTQFTLFDFNIPTTFALQDQTPELITIKGDLPIGTIVFAYGADTLDNQKPYSTAMTNAGAVTTLAAAVPEPSTALAVGFMIFATVPYVAWRRWRPALMN
jgi:hypothetical protein